MLLLRAHVLLNPWSFRVFGAKMLADEHPALFMTKHMEKDMGLALEMAAAAKQKLPVSDATRTVYSAALEDGQSEEHMSSIYRTLKKMD